MKKKEEEKTTHKRLTIALACTRSI